MRSYINSEFYESFDRLGLNPSYEEIKEWVIENCKRYEELLGYGKQNIFLKNSRESLFIENLNLSEDITELEEEIEKLKNYIKALESKLNEQTTNNKGTS